MPELVETIDALEKQLHVNESELEAELNSLSNITLDSPVIEVAEPIQPIQPVQTAELELLQPPLNHELIQPLQPLLVVALVWMLSRRLSLQWVEQ